MSIEALHIVYNLITKISVTAIFCHIQYENNEEYIHTRIFSTIMEDGTIERKKWREMT